ncbi:MAG TPA: CBS domain-containing protein [Acholeplasmatales bacterium]|nr:CBS domain-containing protein [Acholeplasmatales bacterium]
MNILAFIKPKNDVVFVYDDFTIKEVMDKLEKYRFAAIPILNRDGNYVGTLTEGDLLWKLKESGLSLEEVQRESVALIKRNRDNAPINMNAQMDELIGKATDENFVPIVDDHNLFIGIVTRKAILNYFFEHRFIVL